MICSLSQGKQMDLLHYDIASAIYSTAKNHVFLPKA